MLAAQALKDRYPELANKFVQTVLAEIRSNDAIDPQVLQSLAEIAPEETIALLPNLKAGSDRFVINGLLSSNQPRRAADLIRASLAKGKPIAPGDFRALTTEDPGEAKKLFTEMLAAFSFDTARPHDLYTLTNSAVAIAPIAPGLAADVYDRIVAIASASDYGNNATPPVSATFQVGETRIVTTNWRDTLLVAAGGRLLAIAPGRFAKRKEVFAKWNLAGPITVKGLSLGARPNVDAGYSPELMISDRIGKLRGLPDDERPRAVLELAQAIHALPKGSKWGLAFSLANLATEGDNGQEAMDAVAASLGEDSGRCASRKRLPRIGDPDPLRAHAQTPSDPSLDAADAVLTLRERIHQESGFSLTSMDGKTYSLDALRGKIVLLNFWATWCPPCRKEMPDMEALYRRFRQKGLVVLAVSDEDRETVAGFLAKQNYTFPVLLDPGRKTAGAFSVEGIPKSFIFDAQGQLVAEAMDMRTERQFLDLLKEAGLQ
jgi:peroxiredoxin